MDIDNPLGGSDLIMSGTGQLVVTHGADVCSPPCPVHSPSEHHMRTWPLHWRGDRKIIERICVHVIGHPDPDDLRIRTGSDGGVHGCDGCCREPEAHRAV